jgi:hypothetical protein
MGAATFFYETIYFTAFRFEALQSLGITIALTGTSIAI